MGEREAEGWGMGRARSGGMGIRGPRRAVGIRGPRRASCPKKSKGGPRRAYLTKLENRYIVSDRLP